jgi:hypothetical protein
MAAAKVNPSARGCNVAARVLLLLFCNGSGFMIIFALLPDLG